MRLLVVLILVALFPLSASCSSACRPPKLLTAPSSEEAAQVLYPTIRTELLEMGAEDQAIRRELLGPAPRNPIGVCMFGWRFSRLSREDAIALVERLEGVDRPNRERLRVIMDEIGWPGIREVGSDGSQMAWLLAQHAPVEFQRECLGRMIPSAREGNVAMEQVRMLHLMACDEDGKPAKDQDLRSSTIDPSLTLEDIERCLGGPEHPTSSVPRGIGESSLAPARPAVPGE